MPTISDRHLPDASVFCEYCCKPEQLLLYFTQNISRYEKKLNCPRVCVASQLHALVDAVCRQSPAPPTTALAAHPE